MEKTADNSGMHPKEIITTSGLVQKINNIRDFEAPYADKGLSEAIKEAAMIQIKTDDGKFENVEYPRHLNEIEFSVLANARISYSRIRETHTLKDMKDPDKDMPNPIQNYEYRLIVTEGPQKDCSITDFVTF
jgi:hypothetical protein